MREILFKAKTKLEIGQNNGGKKDGVWVKGHYRDRVARPTISQFEFDRADYIDYEIDRETLSQYTGLKDKNGNKIFENDIVTMTNEDYVIVWETDGNHKDYKIQGFGCNHIKGYMGNIPLRTKQNERLEIIGNKFDNKELLGE